MTDPRTIVGQLVERFEDVWQAGRPPDLAAFLRSAADLGPDDEARGDLLVQLVKVDLEYRWRAWACSRGEWKAWRLADYARRLPELGPPDRWPNDLIVAEYKNRRLWGDEPDRSEYLHDLGPRAETLRPMLAEADRAIADLGPPEALQALRLDDRENLAFLESLAGAPHDRRPGAGGAWREDTRDWTDRPSGGARPGDGVAETEFSRDLTEAGDTLGGEAVDPELTTNQSYGGGSGRTGAGRNFGDYELIQEVGRGGMGVVYKAREIGLNRIVALKLTFGDQLSSSTAVQRFMNEAEAAGKLDHPNIVPVYRSGQHDGRPFFAMGFVEGMSLAKRIAQGPLPQLEAAEVTWTIAVAIAYAHSQGVVHRDLKPGNVLMGAGGQPKVADFGLAKMASTDSALTITGEILGTPSYMAPEQAEGRTHDIGPPVDIYALGAILYCILTGRPPFQAPTTLETLSLVKSADPVSPRRLQPKVGRDLETICLKCLSKSPAHRYASASAVADDLRRFLDNKPILARPPRVVDRIVKFARRHKAEIASLAGSLAVGGLILAVALALRGRDRTRRVDRLIAEARSLLDRAATAKGEAADPLYEQAIIRLGQVQELDPGSRSAVEEMTRLYVDRCRRSIRGGEYDTARALLLPLRNLLGRDGRSVALIDRLDREVSGTSRVRIASRPPDALVRVATVDANGGVGKPVRLGTTPVAERDLAPGNYVFTFTHPGQIDVAMPVLVARGESLDMTVDLPRPDEVPLGMVYVPGGRFLVGDTRSGTARVVDLPSYFIDRTEVTGAEYEKFVTATNGLPPDVWLGSRTCPPDMRHRPVYNVSWYDAYLFARWAAKRLPTGAEWEKAARGVDGRPFPWGSVYDPRKVLSRDAYFVLRDEERTLLVGRRPEGASPYGCLDMAGGVWEWTLDRERPGQSHRIIRGGAYNSPRDDLLTFHKEGANPGGSGFGAIQLLGFRCVKPARPEPPIPDLPEALATGLDLAEAAEYFFVTNRADKIVPLAHRLLALNPRSVPGNFWMAICVHDALKTSGVKDDAKEYEGPLNYLRTCFLQQRNFKVRSATEKDVTVKDQLAHLLAHGKKAADRPQDDSPLDAEKWFDHADKALGAGRHGEAEVFLRKVLALDPDNEVAIEQMATIEDARGNRAVAANYRSKRVEGYRNAVREDPENADLRDQFAEFLLDNELELKEATDQIRKATELAPGIAKYRLTLAQCLEKASDPEGAFEQNRIAAELDPEDEITREKVSLYLRKKNLRNTIKP